MLGKLVDKLKTWMGNKKGFTLIEVVIVLAIAGLIFVIVFLAVTQAQAARRDTQRKSALNQLVAAANQYAGNNSGAIPADAWCGTSDGAACAAAAAPSTYWQPGNDPNGSAYSNVVAAIAGGGGTVGQYHFENTAVCAATGGGVVTLGATARQFAAQIVLERGAVTCQDNQ